MTVVLPSGIGAVVTAHLEDFRVRGQITSGGGYPHGYRLFDAYVPDIGKVNGNRGCVPRRAPERHLPVGHLARETGSQVPRRAPYSGSPAQRGRW